jgi:hypothetical protein
MSMTNDPGTAYGSGRRRAGWTGGRIAAVVAGGILALVALGLIVSGALALGAANSNGGWVSLGHGSFKTDGYAVVTDPVDWSQQKYVSGVVDKVRVSVTPADPSTPVFVGIARESAVQSYLDGAKYATAHGAPDYGVTYTLHQGTLPPMLPENAAPWAVKASGMGTQTLQFDAEKLQGRQVAVVMNAGATPAVSGTAESKVTAPWLNWLGAGLLIAGLILAVGAVLLIVLPIRRARAYQTDQRQQQPPQEQPPVEMPRAA